MLDQLEQSVQIHGALVRQPLGQFGVESRLAESCAAPRNDVGRSSRRAGLVPGSKVHAFLARPYEPFLPSIAYLANSLLADLARTPK